MFLDLGPSDSLQSFFILCILYSIKIQQLQSRANYDTSPQVPLKTNLIILPGQLQIDVYDFYSYYIQMRTTHFCLFHI